MPPSEHSDNATPNVTPRRTSTVYGEPVEASPGENYNRIVAKQASKILSAVDDAAKKADIICDTIHVIDRYPADGIIETATTRSCDLIVTASHGRRGLRRLILGSQANEVLTRSAIPVLICRHVRRLLRLQVKAPNEYQF
jgi:nucleotide-binding universal stress UspA family protein